MIFILFYFNNTFSQHLFAGEIVYKTQSDKNGSERYTTLIVSQTKILCISDSAEVNDGFNKHLLSIDKGKAFYYMINEVVGVALRQEFIDSCNLYAFVLSNKPGYGKSKSEGNPTTLKDQDLWFSASYTYNVGRKILSNNSPVKCFPLFFIMNGSLIEESQSVYRVNKSDFRRETKLISINERQMDDSVFEIPNSVAIEEYSHIKRSQISYLYHLKKKMNK